MSQMKFEKLARELLGTGKTVEITQDCASWTKRGGYADSKLAKIYKMLDKYGFKLAKDVDHSGVPDGSVMKNGRTYRNPNGEVTVVVTEFYGRTPDSNRYSVKMSNSLWGERR